MLKRLVKLVIAAVFFLVRELTFFLLKISGFPRPRFVALMYHQVRSQDKRAFERQIDMIIRCGTPVFADYLPARKSWGRFIAITFDDSLAEALATAGSLLKQRRLPSTWFVITKRLGSNVDWIRNSQKANHGAPVACIDDIVNLDKSLFQIASHTAAHSVLPALPQSEAFSELTESRAFLIAFIKGSVTSIALPYGEYDPITLKLCRDAGYQWAFANVPVWRWFSSEGFLRGRVSVEPHDWPCEFWLKIRGGYDWQAIGGYIRYQLMPRLRKGSQTTAIGLGLAR